MKILFVAAFLAMAVFANAKMSFKDAALKAQKGNKGKQDFADIVNRVIELNAQQKKEFAEAVTEDLKKTTDKKCMDELKPVLADTTVKYLTKIVKGEPFYEKEGKEFKLSRFFLNSKLFKKATGETCMNSMLNGLGKALKTGVNKIFSSLKSA